MGTGERCSLDATAQGPWSLAIWAGTLVVRSATMPGVCFTAPLDGLAGTHATCSHHRPMDVIIMLGLMPVADDAMSILAQTELFVYRRSVWSMR